MVAEEGRWTTRPAPGCGLRAAGCGRGRRSRGGQQGPQDADTAGQVGDGDVLVDAVWAGVADAEVDGRDPGGVEDVGVAAATGGLQAGGEPAGPDGRGQGSD